ncbi:hypothetical protein P22_0415 [Propionispora sp. 2/2-37]|uniref:sugar-binding transcriptional regulator n=1 Tax=Propionispora sp. 2/2-37 TaxID=1677858 RepID=UPI0006C08B53|nr:sugar-binding domain-containing protein [Propionispora sp. 2/2-37]CUH94349.1 hypothetical protein P22_0415 [Propionispora sp. 2/2-37]
MEKIVQLHRKFAPDLIHTIEERYNILRHIRYNEPIGRRALAGLLGVGERAVRVQVDFLKEAGMVEFSLMGMRVTSEGEAGLRDIGEYVHLLHGFSALETELSRKLGIKRVIVIPGDSDEDSLVQRELGRVAAGVLGEYLGDNMTIAVSGGSTMAMVAEGIYMTQPTTTVVAARGGLGEKMEYQANTIAAKMATKLGGRYRLLHMPERVSEEVVEAILASDPNVPAVAQMIKKADILVHSIGQAKKMAVRRGLDKRIVNEILRRGAVGETLGHYCTLAGEPVYITNSVGLRLEDLAGVGTVIAVAGGREKAEAIVAVIRAGQQDVLVTDEAAARSIQKLCRC